MAPLMVEVLFSLSHMLFDMYSAVVTPGNNLFKLKNNV